MVLPLLPFGLFVCSAIYAGFFVRGLVTGKASTRYHRGYDRACDPLRFWAAQAFNGIFAVISGLGGVMAFMA